MPSDAFKGYRHGQIRISYFDPISDVRDTGPTYETRSVLFESGINRELMIDYGSFAVERVLKKTDFLESKKCK